MISALINKLFRRERGISEITAPISKILEDLKDFSAKQLGRATDARLLAGSLNNDAAVYEKQASEATRLARHYGSLVNPAAE